MALQSTTLDDDFLDDLNDLEDEFDEEENTAEEAKVGPTAGSRTVKVEGQDLANGGTSGGGAGAGAAAAAAVGPVKTLLQKESFQKLLKRIEEAGQSKSAAKGAAATLSGEVLYNLVVEGNDALKAMEAEVGDLHGKIADAYEPKFPELKNLVGERNHLDYARVVRLIGNEMDITKLEAELADVVAPSKVMVISVTGSTTAGNPLDPVALARCLAQCDAVLALEEARSKILLFVQAQMAEIAPNLTMLVGPGIASRLLALVGGLSELAKVPAGYVHTLGQEKKSLKHGLAGFSSTAAERNTGIIAETALVTSAAPALKVRAMRALSGKIALATRVDASGQSRDGSLGQRYRCVRATYLRIYVGGGRCGC